jgi:hypothetical protein
MSRRVIKRSNIPTGLPLLTTGVSWLLMDRFRSSLPAWSWGVYWTLLVFLWLIALYSLATETQVDILPKK